MDNITNAFNTASSVISVNEYKKLLEENKYQQHLLRSQKEILDNITSEDPVKNDAIEHMLIDIEQAERKLIDQEEWLVTYNINLPYNKALGYYPSEQREIRLKNKGDEYDLKKWRMQIEKRNQDIQKIKEAASMEKKSLLIHNDDDDDDTPTIVMPGSGISFPRPLEEAPNPRYDGNIGSVNGYNKMWEVYKITNPNSKLARDLILHVNQNNYIIGVGSSKDLFRSEAIISYYAVAVPKINSFSNSVYVYPNTPEFSLFTKELFSIPARRIFTNMISYSYMFGDRPLSMYDAVITTPLNVNPKKSEYTSEMNNENAIALASIVCMLVSIYEEETNYSDLRWWYKNEIRKREELLKVNSNQYSNTTKQNLNEWKQNMDTYDASMLLFIGTHLRDTRDTRTEDTRTEDTRREDTQQEIDIDDLERKTNALIESLHNKLDISGHQQQQREQQQREQQQREQQQREQQQREQQQREQQQREQQRLAETYQREKQQRDRQYMETKQHEQVVSIIEAQKDILDDIKDEADQLLNDMTKFYDDYKIKDVKLNIDTFKNDRKFILAMDQKIDALLRNSYHQKNKISDIEAALNSNVQAISNYKSNLLRKKQAFREYAQKIINQN